MAERKLSFKTTTSSPSPAVQKMIARRERREHGKTKPQREMDAFMQKLNRENAMRDSGLREIEAKYDEKNMKAVDAKCPKCGESTRGNTMNGKPWCFKCDQKKRPVDKKEAFRQCSELLNPGLKPKN